MANETIRIFFPLKIITGGLAKPYVKIVFMTKALSGIMLIRFKF